MQLSAKARTNQLIYCIAVACLAWLPAALAQTDESAVQSTQEQAAPGGLHGKVQANELNGKANELNGKANELNGKASSLQEASMDTPDEPPAKPPVQTLKQSPKLQGGIKRSSIFAKVHHPKMTSDDFRKLEHGVLGLVAINRMVMLPVVTEVFPTCPAERAGIRPGDVLISEDGYYYKPGVGQKEIWATLGGKAGTKVALTVRRHHQVLTFNLVRMNIEDIQDKRVRRQFEALLRHYGPPGSAHPNDN